MERKCYHWAFGGSNIDHREQTKGRTKLINYQRWGVNLRENEGGDIINKVMFVFFANE